MCDLYKGGVKVWEGIKCGYGKVGEKKGKGGKLYDYILIKNV